mmetsp:Transcript_10280/g.31938  ORF Transcript_10280/g.31938 Transcript_10280/m.31938 type:complete len:222 (+) Transcript_10280:348-1013(+)
MMATRPVMATKVCFRAQPQSSSSAPDSVCTTQGPHLVSEDEVRCILHCGNVSTSSNALWAAGRSSRAEARSVDMSGCLGCFASSFRVRNMSLKLAAASRSDSCSFNTITVSARTAGKPSELTNSNAGQRAQKGSHRENNVSQASGRNMSDVTHWAPKCGYRSARHECSSRSKAETPVSSSGSPGSQRPRILCTSAMKGGKAASALRKRQAMTAATKLMPWQ